SSDLISSRFNQRLSNVTGFAVVVKSCSGCLHHCHRVAIFCLPFAPIGQTPATTVLCNLLHKLVFTGADQGGSPLSGMARWVNRGDE
ncbi:hypothetical protein, partial [endosymbiont of Ridgeia piscesae]|uniref:hypothetical protein n=1 Tax=endosymbiont of Ridgeia piscesae TaxID=54398 RepID=UPI001F27C91B